MASSRLPFDHVLRCELCRGLLRNLEKIAEDTRRLRFPKRLISRLVAEEVRIFNKAFAQGLKRLRKIRIGGAGGEASLSSG